MQVLQIIHSNTSTLDTTLPQLWDIRRKFPESKIVILYCVTNKNQILRNNSFIIEFCDRYGIIQLDLSDLFKLNKLLKNIIKYIFSLSRKDNFPVSDFLRNPFNFIREKKYLYVAMSLRFRVETMIGEWFLNPYLLDKYITPDVIFFDLRFKSRFVGRDKILHYLYNLKTTTFLIPHSPHDVRPGIGIAPFDEKREYFPLFAKYWIPFKYSQISKSFPERKEDFVYMNYPAFDSDWINLCYEISNINIKKNKIVVLIMLRDFYKKNYLKDENDDIFTVEYSDNYQTLKRIQNSFKRFDKEIEFIIKPHPKISKPRLKQLLDEVSFSNYIISYSLFYELLPKVDLVISNFTTSLLLPVFFKKPVIIIQDDVQNYINKWKILKDMYCSLSLYCTESENLEDYIKKGLSLKNIKHDVLELRKYFPDRSLHKNTKLIDDILKKYNVQKP